MANKHELEVASLTRETRDSISIGLDIPAHLRDDFDYEPGQYITVEVDYNEGFERRAYSICSSVFTDDELRIAVKRLPGGKVSTYLNEECKVGQSLKVFSPEGNFIPTLNEDNVKDYILIAGGSGITPIMSILKSVLAFENNSSVALLYGNREEQDIIFKSQLDQLEQKYPKRLQVIHTLSGNAENWNGRKGRIDERLIDSLLKEKSDNLEACSFFICGPSGLISDTQNLLQKRGVPESQIKREFFTKEPSKPMQAPTMLEGDSSLTIILDDEKHQFEIDGQTLVLEAAIDAGLDAPYSCKIAACCTCRAKILEGTVSMEDDDILTESEIAEGFILTCQAYPTSKNLVISYDEA